MIILLEQIVKLLKKHELYRDAIVIHYDKIKYYNHYIYFPNMYRRTKYTNKERQILLDNIDQFLTKYKSKILEFFDVVDELRLIDQEMDRLRNGIIEKDSKKFYFEIYKGYTFYSLTLYEDEDHNNFVVRVEDSQDGYRITFPTNNLPHREWIINNIDFLENKLNDYILLSEKYDQMEKKIGKLSFMYHYM